MIDFGKITPNVLTKDWILNRVDDAQIFFFYFGQFELNKPYYSKLISDKNTKSITFFLGDNGKIMYYDFREGIPIDCFEYVKRDNPGLNFYQVLEKIAADFGLIDKSTIKVPKKVIKASQELDKTVKKETLIQFIPEEWNKQNSQFWSLYEITIDELKYHNIYPISRLFLNKREIYSNGIQRYAYPETWEDGSGVQVYSPDDKQMKWLSSVPLDVPYGIKDLNYNSDRLIIGKSLKDMIILRRLFPSVMATRNESLGALNKPTIKHLQENFKEIIMIFDADDPGVASCTRFNEFGFKYWNIPRDLYLQYGIKDPSDCVKSFGMEYLIELFKQKNLL